MARRSNIERLPREIQEAIAELRRNGRTIDEILARLHEIGVSDKDVSRSGLGRHVQELDAIAEEARQQQILADAIVGRFGDEPDSSLARANVELMHGLLFKLSLAKRSQDGADLSAEEIAFMARSLSSLATASKLDVERIEKIEKRAVAKAIRDAETKAGEKSGRRATADDVLRLMKEAYG